MTSYEFALKLNREVTDEEIDALYEAGCGDAAIETGPLGAVAHFSREAPSLAEAIAAAARDIDKVPGLRAVGVQCDNMVTMLDIATRTGVSREAVRLWTTGQRGPGGFPKPLLVTTGGEKLWDWEHVALWLERHQRLTVGVVNHAEMALRDVRIRIMLTANRVLAARDALRSEPDEEVRQEFERLLEDA